MYKLKTTAGFGAGGTRNYENMENKPQINGVELVGNKSSNDLGLQPAGEYLTAETDPIFNASPAKNITNQNISNWNAKAEVSDIPTKVSQLQNDSAFIDKNVNNLTNYTLATGTGSTIELSINSSTYVMTMNLKNSAGTVISTGSVDLPLESVVVSGSYDSTNKKIILTLQSGSTIEIPVGDLVSGLQPEITSNNKLSSDLVDDTNKTNKFVSASEKTTWNAKYDKPSGGIPSTDMSSAVQTSLGKADTALQEHQDISGKEDKTNKVTSISSASTDTQYPSAKCVYDSQEEQNGLIDNALSIYNTMPKVSGTGEELILDDTAECWMPEISLKGNTSQESTSGKNLALTNNDYASEYPNCTVTRNNDNTLTINGTLDALKYPVLVNVSSVNIPAGDYTLSVYDNLGNEYNADLNWYDSNNTAHYVYKGNSAKTFTASDNIAKMQIQPYLTAKTYNNVILYIQLESGTTATDYEPYTGGQASPNPDYPQDIHVVSGDNVVKIENKNLFDGEIELGTIYPNNGTLGPSDTRTRSKNFTKVKPNTTYTFTKAPKGRRWIIGYTKGKIGISDGLSDYPSALESKDNTVNVFQFTTTATTEYIKWYDTNSTDLTEQVQIEQGSTATSYVEHKEQTYHITLPTGMELCKIGDYEDEFVKQSDGKWYKYSAIGKVVLDENTVFSNSTTNENYSSFFIEKNDMMINQTIKANYFTQMPIADATSASKVGIASHNTLARIYLTIETSDTPISTFMSTHNTIVYYPLATPTYILLNDTLQSELEAIKNAMSYQDQTNILQVNDDAPFIIKASAVYDLNKLVSRVATLETE